MDLAVSGVQSDVVPVGVGHPGAVVVGVLDGVLKAVCCVGVRLGDGFFRGGLGFGEFKEPAGGVVTVCGGTACSVGYLVQAVERVVGVLRHVARRVGEGRAQ